LSASLFGLAGGGDLERPHHIGKAPLWPHFQPAGGPQVELHVELQLEMRVEVRPQMQPQMQLFAARKKCNERTGSDS